MDRPLNSADQAPRAVPREKPAARFEVEAFSKPSDIEREWRQLESSGIGTVFQRYDWVDAYARHVLPHEHALPSIVLGRLHGEPAFILPLAISRKGPVRIAEWIGGKHSSYNFGLWTPEAAAAVAGLSRAEIERMLGTALDGADCAILGRMPETHDGVAQPFAALLHSPSSTEGYSLILTGGFNAVLERTNGASRRKRVRAKERKMAEIGALGCETLRDPTRAKAALEFFFEQKALRLAEQGLSNSFAEPGINDFFRDLLERSYARGEPLLEVAELSVGGKTRAVTGSGIHRGRVNVYFMTFTRDEIAVHSPGNVLTFKHIEECCERGMTYYDLGIGYEDYKTHWCDIIHKLNDGYAAFTPLGTATIAAIRLGEATKHRLRQNESLWKLLRSARAYLTRKRGQSGGE